MKEENFEQKVSPQNLLATGALPGEYAYTQVNLKDRSLQRLKLLRAIDRAILSARTLEDMGNASLPLIRRLLACKWAGIFIDNFHAGNTHLMCVDPGNGNQPAKGWKGPLRSIRAQREEEQVQTTAIENISEQASSSPFFRLLRESRVLAYLSIPLISAGKTMGALSLGRDTPGAWKEEDLQVAAEVADQLSTGICNLNLHANLELREAVQAYLITKRTADLQSSRVLFQALFENPALGIALLDHEGRVVVCNSALQQIYGYSLDELKGIPFSRLCLPEESNLDVLKPVYEMEAGQTTRQLDARHVRKDGSVIWLKVALSALPQAGPDPLWAILTVEDVTQQKQTQIAMIQAEKLALTGRLAASLAHEINNPLQSSIGCLALAGEVMAEGGDTGKYLQVATGELERAARIVAQLRDLNQQPSAHRREPVDLNSLLAQMLMLISKQCKDHAIQVNWNPAEKLPLLKLTADQVQQVFLNLALNAIDAMPHGGSLTITLQPTSKPKGVQIEFSDTGQGIPPELRRKIFDPFYSTRPDGLGLGLYISKQIIEDHAGNISISSRAGQGTVFSIWLPYAA